MIDLMLNEWTVSTTCSMNVSARALKCRYFFYILFDLNLFMCNLTAT